MKRSLLIKSILEVPWVHCNGLYEMNTSSYGSFIKVVNFVINFHDSERFRLDSLASQSGEKWRDMYPLFRDVSDPYQHTL